MGNLNIIPNDITKNQITQNQQTNTALTQIQSWGFGIGDQIYLDYTEPIQPSDETTSSTSYVNFLNFTKNFSSANPVADMRFNLTLKGTGFVAVVLNGSITDQIPFQYTGFTNLGFAFKHAVTTGNNTLSLQWKATNGTLTKASSNANAGYNRIQAST